MQTHYDAFISYRHSPKDSAVAQQIHRQLERFRVPKAIQKATGKNRIRRIFRDNEELPLSVNLSDDIREALKNSDYLIVICSPRTAESQWVQREIEIFLETHTVDKVLIVLAEGEPADVVPSMLIEGREPLCCNYRLSPRKAKQIELPRLAATILGCRYDDLRQRQRQYRTRRLISLFSVALAAAVALAFYFFQTSRKIQDNYEQALINQSRYLSSTSLDLLQEGDRLSAIALALEALPSADSPRPWIPEAEYALGCATNAYTSTPNVLPVTSFSHSASVDGFLLSNDGRYLISWDSTDQLYVWDTQTCLLQRTINPGFSLTEEPVLLSNGKILFANSDKLSCWSWETGQEIWNLLPDDFGYFFSGIMAIEDTELVITVCGDNLLLIHSETGAVQSTIPMPDGIDYFSDIVCSSPDGKYVLCVSYDYSTGYQPILLSLEEETFRPLDLHFYFFDCGYFSDNGKLYLAGMLEDTDSSYALMDMVSLCPSLNDVLCIDLAEGATLWHTQTTYYQVNYGSSFGAFEYVGTDGTVTDAVYCAFGNVCVVLDAATGQLLSRGEATASILNVVHTGTRLRFLLTDGSLGVFYPEKQTIGSIRYFTDELSAGYIINDYSYFILPWTDSRILHYSGRVYDDNYTFVSGSEDLTSQLVIAASDDLAVFADRDNLLSGCDLESRSILWQTQLPTNNRYDICVAGLTADQQLLILQNKAGYGNDAIPAKLLSVDMNSGYLGQKELPLSASAEYSEYSIIKNLCALWDNQFAYLVNGTTWDINHTTGEISSKSADILMLLDSKTGDLQEYPLPVSGVAYLLPDTLGEKLLLGVPTEDTGMLCLILDRATGEVDMIDTPIMIYAMANHAQAAWSPDGKLLAVPGEEDILLLNPDGSHAGIVSCKDLDVFSMHFNPAGELLVLYTDATLCRYNSSGSLLSRTNLHHYTNDMHASSSVGWYFGQEGIGINIGRLCTILDPESWQSYAYVPNCLLYAPKLDRFFVQLDTRDSLKIACYDRYTTEALIAMAKEILGDNGLTEDQRNRYGLN